MRARVFAALVCLGPAVGCGSSSPAAPGSALPFSGQWAGSFTISQCDVTGMYRDCGAFAPGTSHPVWLGLQQQGQTVSGIGGYGSAQYPPGYTSARAVWREYYQRFAVPLSDDRSFTVTFTLGTAPQAVHEMTFDVTLDAHAEISGTLRARNSWYKVSGDYTMTGPIRLRRVPRQ